GAVNNRALMQLKADVLGIAVHIPTVGEATLAGAAALLFKRQFGEAASQQFLQTAFSCKECFEPDEGLHRQYKEIQTCRFQPLTAFLGRNLEIEK
ncbi:MAG: hypothetical protein K2P39_03785, partial [Lachnospiraceae bacterium]|nr:hypothetical protein [Lachnospiraceae bacterium]